MIALWLFFFSGSPVHSVGVGDVSREGEVLISIFTGGDLLKDTIIISGSRLIFVPGKFRPVASSVIPQFAESRLLDIRENSYLPGLILKGEEQEITSANSSRLRKGERQII